MTKKVYVGLSGGVDSSVSAAILKKQGYDVHGVFIKVWQPDIEITGGCTWKEDRLDAMRVCAKLNIPFYTLDLEKEYKKEVVDYMISEYKAGRTPNPDVMCNKYVKFGGFFDWAIGQGADFVATGHYAQVLSSPEDEAKLSGSTDIFLLKNSSCSRQSRSQVSPKVLPRLLVAGKDKNKDQSYFLWTLTQKQLAKTLFPVGELEKLEVRKLAKKFNLDTATKKDSQGLCFIGKVDMADFLRNFIKTKPGKVLNEKGEMVGVHEGAVLFTIGQRHGFKLTKKTSSDDRSFVIAKDIKTNTITVSQMAQEKSIAKGASATIGSEEQQSSKTILISDVNWVAGHEPDLSKNYLARIRYRQPLEKCKIVRKISKSILRQSGAVGTEYEIVFEHPPVAPASGQSAVIYDKDNCLGGGVIQNAPAFRSN